MKSMIGGICLIVGSLWLLLMLAQKILPWVKSLWPNAVPDVISSVVDKANDYADETVGFGACQTLALLAKKQGNKELAQKATEAWALVLTFDDESTAPPEG